MRGERSSVGHLGILSQLVRIGKGKVLGTVVLFVLGTCIFGVGIRWLLTHHPGGFPFMLLGSFILVPGTYGVYEVWKSISGLSLTESIKCCFDIFVLA